MSSKERVSGISLRLWDAERDMGALMATWGLTVGRSWMAGTQRETPRGNRLEGVWPDSYAYAKLAYPADCRLSACLDHVLDYMAPFTDSLVEFVESGGYAELFVHWHFECNSGDVLDWKLLGRLAGHRLALSLDIYPEQQKAKLEEVADDDA